MAEATESSRNALKNRIRGATRARDFDKVKQLWDELLESGSTFEKAFYSEIADEVATRGHKNTAGSLLFSVFSKLKLENQRAPEGFNLLRKIAKLAPNLSGLRDELLARYRSTYAASPGLEPALKRSGLAVSGRHLDQAVEWLDDAFFFAIGDFVRHDGGWGIGEIVDAEPQNSEFIIDFHEKKAHRMGANMARKSLVSIAPEGFEVLVWRDPDRVKDMAENEPLELLKKALRSRPNGQWISRDLRDALSGQGKPLTKQQWTKFWAKARRQARQDPWVDIGPPPKCQMSLRQAPISREAEVERAIQIAKNFDARLKIANSELSNVVDSIKRRAPAPNTEIPIPAWLNPSLIALEKDLRRKHKNKFKQQAGRIEFEMFQAKVAAVFPQIIQELRLDIIDTDTIKIASATTQALNARLQKKTPEQDDPTAGDPTAADSKTPQDPPVTTDPTAAADPTVDPEQAAADPTVDPEQATADPEQAAADPTVDPEQATADPEQAAAVVEKVEKATKTSVSKSLSKKVVTKNLLESIQACEDLVAVAKKICTDGFRRRLVRLIRFTHPENWLGILRRLLLDPPIGLFETIATEMIAQGAAKTLTEASDQVFIKPKAYPIALSSLTRVHFQGKFREHLSTRSDFEVFDKHLRVFDAAYLRYKGAQDRETKAREKVLFEFLKNVLSEKSIGVIRKVLTDAAEDQARRVLFLVRQSPAATRAINTNVEKLLAKTYPKLLAARQGREKDEADTGFVLTTRVALQRQQEELRHLKEVELPENSKDIGAALALGDISENSELDAAYQRRELLTKKLQHLESELSRVAIIDFKKLSGHKVEVGCGVKIKNHETNEISEFIILGPWDTDESKGHISYLSAIAQGILGLGQTEKAAVQLPESEHKTVFEILEIRLVEPAKLSLQEKSRDN